MYGKLILAGALALGATAAVAFKAVKDNEVLKAQARKVFDDSKELGSVVKDAVKEAINEAKKADTAGEGEAVVEDYDESFLDEQEEVLENADANEVTEEAVEETVAEKVAAEETSTEE